MICKVWCNQCEDATTRKCKCSVCGTSKDAEIDFSVLQIADEIDEQVREYRVYWTAHLDKLSEWSRKLRAI